MLLLLLIFAAIVSPSHAQSSTKCDPISGNFTISQYQLYPENAVYDPDTCRLYTANLFNASLGIFDINTRSMAFIIEYPNITGDTDFNLAGIQMNPRTRTFSLVTGNGIAFLTNGQDISGTDLYLQYDINRNDVLRTENLTAVAQGKFGGYQDVEHDPANNAYVVGTFPGTIMKIPTNASGAEIWFPETDPGNRNPGFGGVAAKDWTLIVNDRGSGNLFNFDMRAQKGVPTTINVTPAYKLGEADGMQLPPKYNGTVLIVAEQQKGASVFRDRSSQWKEAEFMGLIPFNDTQNNVTKVVQIEDSVYLNVEVFTDVGVMGPGSTGNRSEFMYVDISADVDKMLNK